MMMQIKAAETVNPEIARLEILSPGCGMLALVLALGTVMSLNVLLAGEHATICAIDGTELVLFSDDTTGKMEKLLCS